MYAVKGGWVGQTFALAPCNESGIRKARIRRSKEERKSMVESFIKKYQGLNGGKFPSLNLTHKEVGGSFYTVREIVRDIIQENRVLGPAKFSSEKHTFDGCTRGFSPESATIESQDYLFQLEIENPAALGQQASATMELNMTGNEQYEKHDVVNDGEFFGSNAAEKSGEVVYMESLLLTESESGTSTDLYRNTNMELNFQDNAWLDKHEDLDAAQLVNGSLVEGECSKVVSTESSVGENFRVKKEAGLGVSKCWQENAKLELKFSDNEQRNRHQGLDFGKYVNDIQVEESDKLGYVESSLIEKHEVDRIYGFVEPNTIELSNPTEDIVVETFPLRSLTMDIDTLDTTLNDSRSLNGELGKKYVNSGNGGAIMDRMDTSVNAWEPIVQKVENVPEASSSNGESFMVHETIASDASNLLEVEDPSRSGETVDIDTRYHNKPAVEFHSNLELLKTDDENQEMMGDKLQARYVQNTVCPNKFYGAKSGCSVELTAENMVKVGSANEIQKENKALEESKPALDRINLESWEGASKKSSEQERNPLLVLLKSFVSAFMKFLSE